MKIVSLCPKWVMAVMQLSYKLDDAVCNTCCVIDSLRESIEVNITNY